MKEFKIWTDGSTIRNPGPGGYAAIIKCDTQENILSGGDYNTTNSRMELMGPIEALKSIHDEDCEIEIFTDSQYVANAFNQHWLENWKKHNWRKANGDPVLNQDLWKLLDTLTTVHKVKFTWVKGHAGNEMNEQCDFYAKKAAKSYVR